MTTTVDRLLDRYVALPGLGPDDVRGCTPTEVEAIRSSQGVPLVPKDVERFLLRAGRKAGPLFEGSDAFFPELLEAKEIANEILGENRESWQLGPESLVIQTHQGYMFDWIPDVMTEPTVVHRYTGGGYPEVNEGLFSEYLAARMFPDDPLD